jgi:hypothetical protein
MNRQQRRFGERAHLKGVPPMQLPPSTMQQMQIDAQNQMIAFQQAMQQGQTAAAQTTVALRAAEYMLTNPRVFSPAEIQAARDFIPKALDAFNILRPAPQPEPPSTEEAPAIDDAPA